MLHKIKINNLLFIICNHKTKIYINDVNSKYIKINAQIPNILNYVYYFLISYLLNKSIIIYFLYLNINYKSTHFLSQINNIYSQTKYYNKMFSFYKLIYE